MRAMESPRGWKRSDEVKKRSGGNNWATRRTHGCRCPDGVTAAYWLRETNGVGSIPSQGSHKTNDEVLAKLLTWGHVLGKHQVVRAG